ncbi:sensor histidine kinase [Plantactinospora sp. S1510]|uniref:Sensor histidine kinase n=1 Tax=Plantactinospora alkalitolerans TaxID=2789879 RepID=A0ABS0GP47_9ACTN|nr:histidine kinase [Plantactinospora alkalitolerans]MBF9127954.1 sensor histidine kinase [Plantactinospora alkalitolerans]
MSTGTYDRTTGCATTEPTLVWVSRHPGAWFPLAWAPVLLVAPLISALAGGQAVRAAYLVLLGATFAGTVWLPYRTHPRVQRNSQALLLLFAALCTGYLVAWHTDRQFIFPLLAIATAVAVRQRSAVSVIASLTISGAVAVGLESRSLETALALGFSTFFAGAATFLVQYLVGIVSELTRTREQLARAAVAEERLRFSRDLHDLLGHTLSVMVVQAQAVRRLLDRDPEAAVEHARDIETTGRQALAEVRDAVGGYRSVRLVEELANARTALAAANVRVDVTSPAVPLDPRVDSLLGWVVREGTTNVLRHARARGCRITVGFDGRVASVDIVNDGPGGTGGEGSGLRGLRERVTDLGGELTVTATASEFRLAASVPVHPEPGRR